MPRPQHSGQNIHKSRPRPNITAYIHNSCAYHRWQVSEITEVVSKNRKKLPRTLGVIGVVEYATK